MKSLEWLGSEARYKVQNLVLQLTLKDRHTWREQSNPNRPGPDRSKQPHECTAFFVGGRRGSNSPGESVRIFKMSGKGGMKYRPQLLVNVSVVDLDDAENIILNFEKRDG